MFDFTPQLQDPSAFDPNSIQAPANIQYQSPNYAPYLTALGGGYTAASQFRAGQQSAALLRANASIAGMEARSEQESGAEQAELYQQHLNATLGKQGAQVGGSGVTLSGSALRSLATTAQLGAQDIARIRTNAARKAWGFETTQAGDLVRADMASAQGRQAALGTLITTGAKAYGQWSAD